MDFALFFPHDYSPPLPHEYQFNLDTYAGRLFESRRRLAVARQAGARNSN
jgi:hypothetical protein